MLQTYTNLQIKDLKTYFERILSDDNYRQYFKTKQRRKPMKANKYLKKDKDKMKLESG